MLSFSSVNIDVLYIDNYYGLPFVLNISVKSDFLLTKLIPFYVSYDDFASSIIIPLCHIPHFLKSFASSHWPDIIPVLYVKKFERFRWFIKCGL